MSINLKKYWKELSPNCDDSCFYVGCQCQKSKKSLREKKLKKIFISGKITGEPIAKCWMKFESADAELMFDFIAVNPLCLPGICFGIEHSEAMKICLEALKDCQAIYMLKDWKESIGAQMEHEFALDNGLEIIYQ